MQVGESESWCTTRADGVQALGGRRRSECLLKQVEVSEPRFGTFSERFASVWGPCGGLTTYGGDRCDIGGVSEKHLRWAASDPLMMLSRRWEAIIRRHGSVVLSRNSLMLMLRSRAKVSS